MKKLKNILSFTIKVLIVSGIVAYLIFYIVAPNETKEFTNKVFEWLSTPVGITGISILGFGYTAYKIISLLPFSNTAKEKLQKELQEEKTKIKAYREEIAKKVNQLNTTKDECIALIGSYKDKLDILEEELLKVCDTIPNAKVKELAEQYKTNKVNLEKQISDKYELTQNSVNNEVDKITYNYNSIIKELNELKEKVYGKETSNN